MKTKRIENIDALKAVCILLVVFCHYVVLPNETIIGNFIMTLTWAAVPCFMMVSGALMHQTSRFSWEKYFTKLVRIYIVLCAWRLIYLLVYFVVLDISFGIYDIVQYLFLLKDLEGVNTGVMWYMIAYLIVMCLYPVTYHLFKNNGRKILAFIMGISFVQGILIPSMNRTLQIILNILDIPEFSFNGISRILPFSNYSNMIFYYVLGAFLYEYKSEISTKVRKEVLPVLLVAGTLGLMAIKYAATHTFFWQGVYLDDGYSHVITIVIAVAMWLIFCEYEEKCKTINYILAKYLGQYTMGIYYLHYIVLAVANILIYPLIKGYYSLSLNCIKTILVTIICLALTVILRKIPVIKGLVK